MKMNGEGAPVAFFIFKRPMLTQRVFEQIRAARPRRLLVVADGPRPSRPEEPELCEAARKIATAVDWPCELMTNFAETNLGCRHRVSSGLDWVYGLCSEAIILEDDCLPCPSFFSYCSTILERYREDARVMHISGANFQDGNGRGGGSYYFSRYSLSWGWASWRRAWRYYDVAVPLWPLASKEQWLASILDEPLEIEYWSAIFDELYRGKIDTWDYQWLFTCWVQSGLSVHPNVNLVSNIGVGPDALHFKEGHSTIGIPTKEMHECLDPAAVIRDKAADQYIFDEHIAGRRMRENRRWFRRIKNKLAIRTRLKNLRR